jgi:hypothetical protein
VLTHPQVSAVAVRRLQPQAVVHPPQVLSLNLLHLLLHLLHLMHKNKVQNM